MTDTHSPSVPMPLLPPLPISECAETTSKVVHVRGLPFAVTRIQIRQFFQAFQIEAEAQPSSEVHMDSSRNEASALITAQVESGGGCDSVCSPDTTHVEAATASPSTVAPANTAASICHKAFSSDSVSAENGVSSTSSVEEAESSKHTSPGATTPRPPPRWSALTDMENSAIVWFPSGNHRGEGFIRLKYSEDVPKAVEVLDRNHFADRIIKVSASTEETRQAYVEEFKQYMEVANKALVLRLRGLPFNAEEEDVRAFIRSVEGIVALDICRDATGRNTGDAFIELENESSVAQAKLLHKKTMGRRYIEVLASSAHDRLCVLRAASRKNGFTHAQPGRHASRFVRHIGADARYGGRVAFAHGRRKDSARGDEGYGAQQSAGYNQSRGALHSSGAVDLARYIAYGDRSADPMGLVNTGYGYGYGYGYSYSNGYDYYKNDNNNYGIYTDCWSDNTVNTAATSQTPTQDATETRAYKVSPSASQPRHPTAGRTHNPYGYSAIDGPSAAASWGCLCEAEEQTAVPTLSSAHRQVRAPAQMKSTLAVMKGKTDAKGAAARAA